MKKSSFIKIGLLGAFVATVASCSQDEINTLLRFVNTVANENPYISKQDRELHNSLEFVIDTHADTANWTDAQTKDYSVLLGKKDIFGKRKANSHGHVDLPRLVEGNMTIQVLALINGGSLDQTNSDTFTTDVWQDSTRSYVKKEFSYADWERNPDGSYFRGPENIPSYEKEYSSLLMPRPVLQYALNAFGHPCELWFSKKAGEEWSGAPIVEDWPPYAQDRLTYDRNGEQRCYPSDTDPKHDYHLEWAKTLANIVHSASALSQNEKNKMRVLKSIDDIENLAFIRRSDKKEVGVMLATEGIYMVDILNQQNVEKATEDLFKTLFNAGYRMMSLTHFVDSEFGGSSTGMGDLSAHAPFGPYHKHDHKWDGKPRGEKLGASPAGIKMFELMFEHGMVVDVAHSSSGLIQDAAEIANKNRKPIISSHSGFRIYNPHIRNLSEDDVLTIAQTGGVIGVGFSETFVGGPDPIDVARAFRYVVDLVDNAKLHKFGDPNEEIIRGIDVVGLGSDYDGGVEATVDVAGMAAITRALTCDYHWFWRPNCLKNNFSSKKGRHEESSELEKIMGDNMNRVFYDSLPQSTHLL